MDKIGCPVLFVATLHVPCLIHSHLMKFVLNNGCLKAVLIKRFKASCNNLNHLCVPSNCTVLLSIIRKYGKWQFCHNEKDHISYMTHLL